MKSLLILIFSFLSLQSIAQVNLSGFSNRYEVRRISGTSSTIKRPLLTLNTIYSGANFQKGYDLEFVLNNLTLHAGTLTQIFNDATEPIITNPTATSDIDQNARVLQHWAFKTLSTYIRTQVKTRKNEPIGCIPGSEIPLVFDPTNAAFS